MKHLKEEIDEIARKIDALGVWKKLSSWNWAVKPRNSVFTYFCTILPGDGKPLKARLLMLEGPRTMQDFLAVRQNRDFGCISSPMELPHFELVVSEDKRIIVRYDVAYLPREAEPSRLSIVRDVLWESFGLMMRFEADETLPLRYADEGALFARVEEGDGCWHDKPITLNTVCSVTEKISFDVKMLKKAEDLPIIKDEVWAVDFRMNEQMVTKEPKPRFVYQLVVRDEKTKALIADYRSSVNPEDGLKALWEAMPSQFLKVIVENGRVPGELRLVSGRVFRFLRPLGIKLPFKLTLHDSLDSLSPNLI